MQRHGWPANRGLVPAPDLPRTAAIAASRPQRPRPPARAPPQPGGRPPRPVQSAWNHRPADPRTAGVRSANTNTRHRVGGP
eukprot:14030094-Alexandrium_andersonii.AAC.1